MATVNTGTTNYDKLLVTLIQKRLEEELRAPLPHLLPGNFRKAQFVKGTNNTMRFLRIADMAEAAGENADPSAGTAPWLTEGTPPTEEDLTIGYEEFSANQAGRVIKLTDKALLQSPIDLMAVAAEKIARNALETADRRVARILAVGTNVYRVGDRARTDLVRPSDVITASVMRRVVAMLKADNVPTFADGYYRAIINPAAVFDFQEDTAVGGWLQASQYRDSQMGLLTGEIGRFAGVRFIESSASKVFVPALGGTDGGSGAPVTLQTSAAADDIIDATAHGFAVGDKVKFTALTGGTGLTVDQVYEVIAANHGANTFQVSATAGGSAVNFTTDITAGTVALANDVHSTIVFGPDAYAFGDWGTIETHITPPGGHDDPLHQSALVGWKGYFGAMLIDEAGPRYIRVESGTGL